MACARAGIRVALVVAAVAPLGVLTVVAVHRLQTRDAIAATPGVHREGLRRLQSMPPAAQSVISGALGSADGNFAAWRSATGWRLQGGGVRAQLGADGAQLRAGGGSLSMALVGLGHGGLLSRARHAPWARHGNRVVLDDGIVREWYAAGPLGIEQGFTVVRRPFGGSGMLTLALGLGGSLRADGSSSRIRFMSRSGAVVLRYGGLVALDGAGRPLWSGLKLSGGKLLVQVDDTGARYPIRIDPLVQQGAKLTGGGESNPGSFGFSVALSADGNTALVGGNSDHGNDGAAWVFTRTAGVWKQQGAKLTGDAGAQFGSSVALSSDGNTALIGGDSDTSGNGAAWVFTRSGSTWSQQVKLTGPGAMNPAAFGSSVALSANGNTALVGGDQDNGGAGAAWVFGRLGSTWSELGGKLTGDAGSMFGGSVALSADGSTALIGGDQDASGSGAAWVFTPASPTWTQQGPKLTGDAGAQFGDSVALSADGNTALIGGDQDNLNGAAWVFTRAGTSWTQPGQKLVGTGAVQPDLFGISVALSSDGNTALIGGSGDNSAAGAAWMFTRAGSSWSQQGAKLTGQGEISTGTFGISVALASDGQTALIGGDNDSGATGAAWVFSPPAPVCGNVSASTPRGGGSVSLALSCTAPPGASLTYEVADAPSHGSLGWTTQVGGQVTYTSLSGFAGSDAFAYQAADQWGVSNTAIASLAVPLPPAPTCANVHATAPKGATTVSVVLSCTGPAGLPRSYAIVAAPADGKLHGLDQANGHVTYTARLGFSGTDRFTYDATGPGGASSPATATITLPRLNRVSATMGWTFKPTLPSYTDVPALVVNSVRAKARVQLSCAPKRCGIKPHTETVPKRRACAGKGHKRRCRSVTPSIGTVDLSSLVAGRHISVGSRLTVSIVEPGAVGKQYIFRIRAGRQPAVTILALAPGTTRPCPGC